MRKRQLTKEDKQILLKVLKRGEITETDIEQLSLAQSPEEIEENARHRYYSYLCNSMIMLYNYGIGFTRKRESDPDPVFTMAEALDKLSNRVEQEVKELFDAGWGQDYKDEIEKLKAAFY